MGKIFKIKRTIHCERYKEKGEEVKVQYRKLLEGLGKNLDKIRMIILGITKKILYGILRQLRQKKYNMKNIIDKEGKTIPDEDKIID